MIHTHILDVAFSVRSEKKDWSDLSAEEIMENLERRVAWLRDHPNEVLEAVGPVGIPEEDE